MTDVYDHTARPTPLEIEEYMVSVRFVDIEEEPWGGWTPEFDDPLREIPA